MCRRRLCLSGVLHMKRPSFQFYPADWRKDMGLQSCSVAARGLWMDMLCIAHECEPYGHLTVNGKAMTVAQIGRHTGLTPKACKELLDELEQAGVSSRTEEGVIFSRRMVRDEVAREQRAELGRQHGARGAAFGAMGGEHGKKGGRPRAENPGSEPPQKPPQKPPQNPLPSSSSSSSPSGERARGTRLPRDWSPDPDGLAFAEQQGLRNGKATAELGKFRDYWIAQPGQKGLKTDWSATWRNWVRRTAEDPSKAGASDDIFAGSL